MAKNSGIQRILGIDPGTAILGYSVIEIQSGNVKILCLGSVKLNKYNDHYTKLKIIFNKVSGFIRDYDAHSLAIESPFYGKNVQSMLKLGRAQGVAIAAGVTNGLPVTEYSPKKIKQSITGNGNASKPQIAAMLKQLLKMDQLPLYFDATDALGVAVCHYLQQNKLSSSGATYSGWKAFASQNKDRIK